MDCAPDRRRGVWVAQLRDRAEKCGELLGAHSRDPYRLDEGPLLWRLCGGPFTGRGREVGANLLDVVGAAATSVCLGCESP